MTAIQTSTQDKNTHNSFKTVGKRMLDVEFVVEVRTVSIQYEVLKTNFLYKYKKTIQQSPSAS